MMKKILIHIRRTIKITILSLIAIFIIIGAVALFYKPTYSVTLDGESIGYTENKSKLQSKINEYIDNGEDENVAFVQVEKLPEYRLCLLKKDIVANDDEIFNKIKEQGTTYYRYYAIAENNEEKAYVPKFDEAENVVNTLKEKESTNIDNISIIEKYETEKKEFTQSEEVVSALYVEKKKQPTITVAKTKTGGSVNTSTNIASGKANLGISLARPISGVITARFGVVSRVRSSAHTGLDISASKGTPIGAAAAGTISFAGYKGSYGNMIVVNHGNGVQTYYCHCNSLNASVGQSVAQGQTIATVGSTGNSTGPHLHLEVRVNGVAYNPENYVY